tara:strand:+ start:2987 stop:3868 length:882 start_codon:yes stop_codon:yes gene_type:complete
MVHITELPIEILEYIIYYCDRPSFKNLCKVFPVFEKIKNKYIKNLKPYLAIIKYKWYINSIENILDDEESDDEEVEYYPIFCNNNKVFISYDFTEIKKFFINFIDNNIMKGNISKARFYYKKININQKIDFTNLPGFHMYNYVNSDLNRLFDINYNFYYNNSYLNNDGIFNYSIDDIKLFILKSMINNIVTENLYHIEKFIGNNKLYNTFNLYKCYICEVFYWEDHFLKSKNLMLSYIRITNNKEDTYKYFKIDEYNLKELFKNNYPNVKELYYNKKNIKIKTSKCYDFTILK